MGNRDETLSGRNGLGRNAIGRVRADEHAPAAIMDGAEEDEGTNLRANREQADREMSDRPITEERELNDQERLDALRASYFAQALPNLPNIPGYHTIWLTTTNPRDPIQGRIRLGYEPITAADAAGWEYASIKTGDYAGCIGVNEMLAFKLPMRLYEMYMKEAHHDAPNREEEKLSSTLNMIREQAAAKKMPVEVGDGSEALGNSRKRPVFEGTSMKPDPNNF
jgi:hypothetical protein